MFQGIHIAIKAKYSHINLIAKDWRTLADFYRKVFGFMPIPAERDFSKPRLIIRDPKFLNHRLIICATRFYESQIDNLCYEIS
jgi:hypothetical protein